MKMFHEDVAEHYYIEDVFRIINKLAMQHHAALRQRCAMLAMHKMRNSNKKTHQHSASP